MFVAFYDESGNDDRSAVFAMAGLLLCHVSSYHFANEWTALMRDFGVVTYHASDFHRRQGEFVSWKEERCTEFENAILQLLLKWEIRHSGVAIIKDDYERAFADTGFHKLLKPAVTKWKKPYLEAFQHVVADLRTYAEHQPRGHYITPVFDRCQEFIGQAEQDYAARNKDGKLGRMYVSTTREYVQLQAADFLVWEYRVAQERRIASGDKAPTSVMDALMPNMFLAKVWSYDYLDTSESALKHISKASIR
jgi:hypothetical protein